jgi:hypothetical protein
MIKRYSRVGFILGFSGIVLAVPLPLTIQFLMNHLLSIPTTSPVWNPALDVTVFTSLPIIGGGLILLGVTNYLKAKRQSTLWGLLLLVLILVQFSPHYVNPPAYLEPLKELSLIAFFLALIVIVVLPDGAKQAETQNSESGK